MWLGHRDSGAPFEEATRNNALALRGLGHAHDRLAELAGRYPMSISVREPPPKQEIRIHSDPASPPPAIHQHAWRHFWRHFLEMTVVMVIGMFAAASVLMITLNVIVDGEITWEQALVDYPAHALLAVAIGMSVPMIPWMRHRGHSTGSANEMALVMAVPVIPFVCLALFDVVKGAGCGLYCLIGFVAMLALMILARSVRSKRVVFPDPRSFQPQHR